MKDEHFLEEICHKKERAWEKLYSHFYTPLCNYAARMIKDIDTAEDIVQGCLVGLWRSSFCFTDLRSLTAYLYRSVYNGSLNFIRDQHVAQRLHQDWGESVLLNENDAVEMALEEEVIARFYEVLDKLPEQQKEILLRSLKGDKVRDIALSLSISENTVKTQKKRAYLFVREQMGDVFFLLLFLFGSDV